MTEPPNNVLQYKSRSETNTPRVLKLVLDHKNSIAIGDKPIFGTAVTINEKLQNFVGTVVSAGAVIGWVNYIEVSQFACMNEQQHYLCASDFLYTECNQLRVIKPIKIHQLDDNMKSSRQIMEFSIV